MNRNIQPEIRTSFRFQRLYDQLIIPPGFLIKDKICHPAIIHKRICLVNLRLHPTLMDNVSVFFIPVAFTEELHQDLCRYDRKRTRCFSKHTLHILLIQLISIQMCQNEVKYFPSTRLIGNFLPYRILFKTITYVRIHILILIQKYLKTFLRGALIRSQPQCNFRFNFWVILNKTPSIFPYVPNTKPFISIKKPQQIISALADISVF